MAGSSAWLPIQVMPPISMMVSTGMPQTTISIEPEYYQSGRYFGLLVAAPEPEGEGHVASIVGMMIASMIAVELMRMVFSA